MYGFFLELLLFIVLRRDDLEFYILGICFVVFICIYISLNCL